MKLVVIGGTGLIDQSWWPNCEITAMRPCRHPQTPASTR